MIQYIAGAAAAGALAGSLLAAWAMGTYKDAIWQASVNEIKIEAANVLIVETDKVIKSERLAQARVRELEADHAQQTTTLAAIERRNRELATQLGGLRDPGRRASRADAVPVIATDPDSAPEATGTGILSREASDILLSAAAEVDELANYAKTCYGYVKSLPVLKQVD